MIFHSGVCRYMWILPSVQVELSQMSNHEPATFISIETQKNNTTNLLLTDHSQLNMICLRVELSDVAEGDAASFGL